MKKFLACCLISLLCICTEAEDFEYRFRYLTIEDGLSSEIINCFLQDHDGFIWIGTDDGLNRYDGHRIEVYKHIFGSGNSIPGNTVRCLFEDSRNNIWIGLKGEGLCCLDTSKQKFRTFLHEPDDSSSISNNDISGILEDREGNIWISVDRGTLDMIDPADGSITHFRIQDACSGKMLNNAITGMTMDRDGNIWLSSWGGGIYIFNPETGEFHDFSAGKELCRHIDGISYDPVHDRIIASSAHDGLLITDNQDRNTISLSGPSGMPSGISAASADAEGNIWAGGQLHIVDGNSLSVMKRLPASPSSVLSNSIRCMYIDNDGTVWIGHDTGISYYNSRFDMFRFLPTDDGTGNSYVFSLCEDGDGVWIGGINSIRKYSFDGKLGQSCTLDSPGNGYNIIQAMEKDRKGNIWAASHKDMLWKYGYDGKVSSAVMEAELPGGVIRLNNIYDLHADRDGYIWVASEKGTVRYNPADGSILPIFLSGAIIYPEEKSHAVTVDSYGYLWIGTEGGLRKFTTDGKELERYTDAGTGNGLVNNYITSVYEDSSGNMWVGTKEGLLLLDRDEGKFSMVKWNDREYGDVITEITEGCGGHLWISTPYEIIEYDIRDKTFMTFNSADGLQLGILGNICVSEHGTVVIGGRNGINVSSFSRWDETEPAHDVVLTGFRIFNREVMPDAGGILENAVSCTEKIEIGHRQSMISFTFISPDMISPDKTKYRYCLEGFDREWVITDAEHNIATYTNLNPGTYRFIVGSSDRSGEWKDDEASITIVVRPPFWKSSFACVLYVMLIAGIAYLSINWYISRAKARIRIRQAENISHEFRTPLSLISGPLTQILDEKKYNSDNEHLLMLMARNIRRLNRLINQFLDIRKLEQNTISLNLQYGDITGFITETVSSFAFIAEEKDITLNVRSDLSEQKMAFDADKLDKILYNLVSNAIKYTPAGGKVDVVSSVRENGNTRTLIIEVSDTGIGISEEGMKHLFSRFFRDRKADAEICDGFGIGLALTHELVKLHGGTIDVRSRLGEGSKFSVSLPMNSHIPQHEAAVMDNAPDEIPDSPGRKAEALILVVEDNADMAGYILSLTQPHYDVRIARNGKQGLDMTMELIPDIIVSDISMPVMSGTEMYSSIRNDRKTSHIPVIFLSAHHSETSILEGLELGAYDYITKPFSPAILLAKIHNILDSRHKLWEMYRESGSISEFGSRIGDNPAEKLFIEQIENILAGHLADTEFGVETLASELHMSTDQLSRKVKALVNSTPYSIILKYRMETAVEFMKAHEKNISEIAYATGYKELSNFSRTFKKYYGKSPKEYYSSISRDGRQA